MSKSAFRDWVLKNPIFGRYSVLRSKAKSRGFLVTITLKEYEELIKKPCHYCGGVLPLIGYGLDRVDSSLGYVSGNCRPCCSLCNYAKHSMSEAGFKDWILRAFTHWASR